MPATRTALVTGGGRGIGRAIALALAGDGTRVAITYRRDEAAAGDTVEAISAAGSTGRAFEASMESPDDLQRLVDEVIAAMGPPDILVHNAGIASRGRLVVDTDRDELLRVISIHAVAAHILCRLLVPAMRARDRADIVLISSVATRQMRPGGAPYNMAKSALEALAFTLAKEEREHGIRVNVVAPGLVVTEMGRRLVRATAGVEDIETLDAGAPFGHVCRPEEVAEVVRFLASPGCSYITGERIGVDGGQSWWS